MTLVIKKSGNFWALYKGDSTAFYIYKSENLDQCVTEGKKLSVLLKLPLIVKEIGGIRKVT